MTDLKNELSIEKHRTETSINREKETRTELMAIEPIFLIKLIVKKR